MTGCQEQEQVFLCRKCHNDTFEKKINIYSSISDGAGYLQEISSYGQPAVYLLCGGGGIDE